MSWVKPTGFVDGGGVWTDEPLAYDDNIATFAYVSCPAGWCSYIELTISEIICDVVQLLMGIVNTQVTAVEIDVHYSGAWHNIYSGAIVVGSFQEFAIGSEQLVTAMRVRFSASKANRQAEIYEADFNEIGGAAYYHGLNVQGEGELALCNVENHPLRMRKGGVTYGLELVAVDDPNASRIRVQTGAGLRAIRKYT